MCKFFGFYGFAKSDLYEMAFIIMKSRKGKIARILAGLGKNSGFLLYEMFFGLPLKAISYKSDLANP